MAGLFGLPKMQMRPQQKVPSAGRGRRRAGQSREDYGLVAPYAESGQDGQDAPLTQVAGRLVRLVCWLSTLVQPVPSRKRKSPLCVARIVSQYGVPAVTMAPGIGTLFQAPAVSCMRAPCAISVP